MPRSAVSPRHSSAAPTWSMARSARLSPEERASGAKFQQHRQRLDHGGATNFTAPDVAVALLAMDQAAIFGGRSEMHQPDRLLGRATARTRDAGDRNRQVDTRARKSALRHRLG